MDRNQIPLTWEEFLWPRDPVSGTSQPAAKIPAPNQTTIMLLWHYKESRFKITLELRLEQSSRFKCCHVHLSCNNLIFCNLHIQCRSYRIHVTHGKVTNNGKGFLQTKRVKECIATTLFIRLELKNIARMALTNRMQMRSGSLPV
jgi:hypothetical protein